jgi:hypothetical protein
LSEPGAPPNAVPSGDDDDDDDAAATPGRRAFDAARVLRVAVIVAGVVSAFAAAHGLAMTVQHYAMEIPAGTVTHVEPARGGFGITIDGSRVAHFPGDILTTTGRPVALRPGMAVGKRTGSLTYTVGDERRGGLLWALRQWLLPARVTLPLVIYFVLSWLLVFRAAQHRRHIAAELLVVPVVRWLAILLASLAAFALLWGCATTCAGLLLRK